MLLGELTRAKCALPSNAQGYILLRDAGLSDRAWDTVETWTTGTYDVATVAQALRKLERPMPGRSGSTLSGMTGLVADAHDEPPAAEWDIYHSASSWEPPAQFMPESLFITPECFDDYTWEEAMYYTDDDEVVFVAGDIRDDVVLTEDETIAILANYGQVRQCLHQKS